MPKWLMIILMPLALAGCVTERAPMLPPMLPMALGPSDPAQTTCLRYADAPAFGDCEAQETVSISRETGTVAH